MTKPYFFSSESVTEGHPDKMADQISDAVLDAHLALDPYSRVACECLLTTGLVVVSGEITSREKVDYAEIARKTVKEIGYDDSAKGFDFNTCGVMVAVGRQSPDIAQGVNEGEGLHQEQGAGDQGMMFGYANNETAEYYPLSISLAQALTRKLSQVRKNGSAAYLRPDGKAQITLEYQNGKPARVDSLVLSTQHAAEVSHEQIVADMKKLVINTVIPANLLDNKTNYYINPTGRFVVGGPQGDCGLTGRKIIVDTYGGHGAHGGGAFSGKDPSKVDRSAAYMARYIAKNIVAAGLAERALIQLSYAIGVAEPLSIHLEDYGTAKVDPRKIETAIREVFQTKPRGIIESLKLLRPIYRQTASYGHFGRPDIDLPWEKTDKVSALKSVLNF